MEANSILDEDTTIERTENPPRKSTSQPSLFVSDKKEQKPAMFASNSTSNVRSVPIIQTWQENEELKATVYSLRTEVQMHRNRYEELKDTMHDSVQKIIDDYITLKTNADNVAEQALELEHHKEEVRRLAEKLDDCQYRMAQNEEQVKKEKHTMQCKIQELEDYISSMTYRQPTADPNNSTIGSIRGTLDDILKRDDPDFTLVGPDDRRIMDLENQLMTESAKVYELEKRINELCYELDDKSARLADSNKQKEQLLAAAVDTELPVSGINDSKTFMIGNANETERAQQLAYIDDLEKQLESSLQKSKMTTDALAEYMNRCSRLEKEVYSIKKNSTFDTSSMLIDGKSSDDIKNQIIRVNNELNMLRTENRELRIRCDQLKGGDGNLSTSFGQTRLLAGTSPYNDNVPTTSNGADSSMQVEVTTEQDLPGEDRSAIDTTYDSQVPLMDTSAARKLDANSDAMFESFLKQQKKVLDYEQENNASFNSSMPPPDRRNTESFLTQKEVAKNSPVPFVRTSAQPPRDLNVSGSSRTSSAVTAIQTDKSTMFAHDPLIQDVQQILDSSAILLENGQNSAADVERMQLQMEKVRNAMTRLFDRLKSSAALFEDILESMGSSSPLAERIKQMRLAFENSMVDHANATNFLEAAERDLTNLSLNFSMLEKSIVSQSFVADVSRRFSIIPGHEEIANSSLLNNSYSPIFKFGSTNIEEVTKLKTEISSLKSELERARAASLRYECNSPSMNTSKRLSDVQIKASQNFEELEVCQATLKRVEGEKLKLENSYSELMKREAMIANQLSQVQEQLRDAMHEVEEEKDVRRNTEVALENNVKQVEKVKKDVEMKYAKMIEELEVQLKESQSNAHVLENELRAMLEDEEALKSKYDEICNELSNTQMAYQESQVRLVSFDKENYALIEKNGELSQELERLREFEKESVDWETKMAKKKKENVRAEEELKADRIEKEARLKEIRDMKQMETEHIDGLERVREEMSKLVKKNMKVKIVIGNASSFRLACDELVKRIADEKASQHEKAEVLHQVNNKLEASLEKENERVVLASKKNEVQKNVASSDKISTSSSKYRCPTRQLLSDATLAVDAIVQLLKTTQNMAGMSPQLKETIIKSITDSRALRDFIHQKLMLFKAIDVEQARNESVDQILIRLEKSYQDLAIVEDECRKLRAEQKKNRAALATIGGDIEKRIKKELGGIAKDMGAVNSLKK